MQPSRVRRKLAVHGVAVELDSAVDYLGNELTAQLADFSAAPGPWPFSTIRGALRSYQQDDILRQLTHSARYLGQTHGLIDLYQEGHVHWLVDERWGMARIDLPSQQWNAWIMPQPKADPVRVVESAVLWPMAQLMSSTGLVAVPAASVVRDGFSALFLCPFSMEPELRTLLSAGYRVIGQRWTALREEEGRMALLDLPGWVERFISPTLRSQSSDLPMWMNLLADHPRSHQKHAFCDAIVVVNEGRHARTALRPLDAQASVDLLAERWPMNDLPGNVSRSALAADLANHCSVFELTLSRNARDLVGSLNAMRYAGGAAAERSAA